MVLSRDANMALELAKRIVDPSDRCAWAVKAIEMDLSDRSGLGDEWGEIDRATRDEICRVWREVLEYVFRDRS